MEGTFDIGDKTALRKRMAAARDALTPERRHLYSSNMSNVVINDVLSPLRNQRDRPLNVCVYAAYRSEADPAELVASCLKSGDNLFAPRILPIGEGMELRKVEALSNWIPGKRGIPEPDPLQTTVRDYDIMLDVVLVPGLAFHAHGGRLGYGGGYYDRLYEGENARGNTETLWIGFAFAEQMTRHAIPIESHDLRLDGVATNEGMLWINKNWMNNNGMQDNRTNETGGY